MFYLKLIIAMFVRNANKYNGKFYIREKKLAISTG